MYGTFTFATAQPHTGPDRRVGRSVIVGCAGLLIMAVTCVCFGVTESTWAANVPEFTSLVHVIDVTKRLNEVQKTDKSLDSVLSMWRMNHMLTKLRQTKVNQGAKSSLVAQRTSDWKDKARAALKMIAIKRADAVALKVRPKLQAYSVPPSQSPCVLQKEEETARQKAMTQIADAHMVMDKIKQADQKDEKLLSWVNQVADLAVWSCHDCICRACGFHHGLLATQPMHGCCCRGHRG